MFSPHTLLPHFLHLLTLLASCSLYLCVAVSHSLILSKEQKAKRRKGKLKQKPTKEPVQAVSILKYIPVMLVGRDIKLRLCQELANIRLHKQLIYYALITPHPYVVQSNHR